MKIALLICLFIFVAMQFIQTDKTNPISVKKLEINAPQEIQAILETSCYDCHSHKVVWPWYSNIAPMSWIIKSHVTNGVKALNFSLWNEYNKNEKQEKLKKIHRVIYKAMPLSSYLSLHEDAKLNDKQIKKIRTWTGVIKY